LKASASALRAHLSGFALVLAVAGCEKVMQDMYDQPRYEPLEASTLFADGRSSRSPVAGTVAQSSGALADASSGRVGPSKIIGEQETGPLLPLGAQDPLHSRLPKPHPMATNAGMPMPITLPLLRRGRERFNVYCSPCHSRAGDGDGPVVRRGFPRPPSFHTDALRKAPLDHFYKVITHGYGIMYAYADRVAPQDRWAIAAYIRALQLSQHARLVEVPAAQRSRLRTERQP
jgi:hypothetical protein